MIRNYLSFNRFSTIEQAHFARRLSFLLHSGITLHESLKLLTSHSQSKRKVAILEEITHKVQSGQFLSSSLVVYRDHFDPLTITIVRIGEQTGSLADNLSYLSHELGKRFALKRKVQGALIYPLFVTLATIGVTVTLILFIFPKLMPIFSSLEIELPFLTRALLHVSEFLMSWWLTILVTLPIVILLIALARKYIRTFRYVTDSILTRIPFLRVYIALYNATQFTRTLRLALTARMSQSDGIDIACEITRNERYKQMFNEMNGRVSSGERMSETFSQYSHLFPILFPEMIRTGEDSGSLSETLGYLSNFYEEEIDSRTKNLSNSLEPFLLIIMGLTVGLIAVAVITPIYEITRHMQSY
jgi:type II secretory pathway component PulF